MAIIACTRCFRKREEAKSQPIADQKICGGCAMDVDGVIGWLEFNGYQLQKAFKVDPPIPYEIADPATGEIFQGSPEPPIPPKYAVEPVDPLELVPPIAKQPLAPSKKP